MGWRLLKLQICRRLEAIGADFIAIWITKISAISVGHSAAFARLALVCTTGGHSGNMKRIDSGPVGRLEADRISIAGISDFSVEWPEHQKLGSACAIS